MPWEITDRAKIVELYFYHGYSVIAAQRAFRNETGRDAPEYRAILRWVKRFRDEGTVADEGYQRQPSVRTDKTIAKVGKAIGSNPRQSVRGLETRTGVKKSTIQRILTEDLQLFPYKMQLTQKLKRGDKTKRLAFCSWFLQKVDSSHSFINLLWMSDEAHFHLDGTLSKQNCRYWSEENPHVTVDKDLYPAYLSVWCAISTKAVIGPFFFENELGVTTVNARRYTDMLERFFVQQLRRKRVSPNKIWFQQDGAKAHTAKLTMNYLGRIFGRRVLSKGAAIVWPPRSPDLTAPDFFLWGYIKSQVYRTPVSSLGVLKQRIRRCIKGISPDTIQAAMLSLPDRCRECIHRRGGHLDNVVFKK